MKSSDKVSMKTRRKLRRTMALVLAVVLVAGLGLSYSPDRVLRAEEIATTAKQIESQAPETEEKEPAKEEAPAKVEEPVKEEAPVKVEEPAKEETPVQEESPAPENVTVQEEPSEPTVNEGTSDAQDNSQTEANAQAERQTEESLNVDSDQELVLDTEEKTEEEEENKEEETYTVSFYNRDAELYKKVEVKKGDAIGGDMPAAIPREDYSAYWAVGEIVKGGQGNETRVTGQRITGSFKPTDDTVVVPDYVKITHTVTFYDKEGGSVIEGGTKTVGPDTNYCLNDIPPVPEKDGNRGKWVYSGGNFNNTVSVSQDMDVWADYDQNVFTVTFMVDGKKYQRDKYYTGDQLSLPTDPTAEGREFRGWFAGEKQYTGGETVDSDLTLNAEFTGKLSVSFVIENEEGKEETLTQYFREEGESIGTMPQDPFVSGKVFEKWVDSETDEEVTADTKVDKSITARAKFRDVGIYNIKAEYYYASDSGKDVIFSTDILQVETHELPYTITAPSTIQTDGDEVSGAPVYYAETPSVTVDKDDFSDNSATVRIKYVKYTATYDIVYLLKDLTGDGYTEIERTKGVQGVLGSEVTPTVKAYENYTLEKAESAKITKAKGQELRVLYKRKNVQLTFETNGGSYVSAITAPYGSSVNLPKTNPTREGYTFGGWYYEESLKNKVSGSVKLDGNTTLYAKWTGDQVNYTVVYMFEKFNDTGTASSYVYDNSRTEKAAAGTTVSASKAREITRKGWEKDTEMNATSNVVVEADGSSVLKVYYKLTEYTFTFNAGTYSSGWSSYDVNAELTGRGVSGTGNLNYSMTVKLGQDISAAWPGNVTGTYTTGGWWSETHSVDFNGWMPAGSNTRYVTKRTSVTEDMLPSSGKSLSYKAQWTGNANTYTVNYWLQNANDDGYTKSDVYSQTYTSSSGNLSAKDINGYTYDHGNSGTQGVTKYDFYYNRLKYQVEYYYGSDQLKTIDDVKFDANISGKNFNWTPTAEQCDVDSDFTFGGWYDNSTCQGDPYNFTEMPASNLVLYAKWNAPTYTVSFVNSDDSAQVSDSVTVEKYKKVAKPSNPERAGYTFDGWYTSAEGSEMFDWNAQITADTTVYARWVKKNLSYIVHYVDEKGETVASDKEVSNPNLKVDQEITEMAIAVAGYRPKDSSKTITLTDSDNVITFEYSEKADSTGYTVRYIINASEYGGNIPVAAEKNVDEVPGDTSSVIEMAAAVNYSALYSAHPELEGIEFHPDDSQKTLVLTSEKERNVLTFTYSSFKHADINLHFVDMAGNKIAGDDLQRLKVGKTFTLGRTQVEGWELSKVVAGTSYDGKAAGSEYKITDAVADSGLEFTLFYRKKATITALSASKQYDGKVLKLPEGQVRVEGLLEGHSLKSVDFTYSDADAEDGRIKAGVTTVTPKNAVISGAEPDDYYTIRYISGTLEVSKINVTIRIEPDRWTGAVYNGETYKAGFTNPSKTESDYVIISHDGYKKEYLDSIWETIKAKATYDESAAGLKYYGVAESDAGDYTYTVGVTLADLPKDENYSVSIYVRPGRLHILPKDASVSTESAAKAYDGKALTNESASITGLVASDEGKVTVKGTGSQTEPGSSNNDYSINWGGVKETNYNIVNESLGTLTVTARSLILTAASDSKTYDGKALTNNKVTAEGLPKGFTLEATASGSQTDAGTSANKVNEGWKIKDASGADVTGRFDVSKTVDGTLTVNKAAATITTGSASKAYDGAALTNAEAKIEGLVNGETATATAIGSQTEIGSSSNTCSVKWGTAKEANYAVTENLGTLVVTDNSADVTLVAASASKTYDGTALTDDSVTATGLPKGFTVEATASGSQKDVGTSANVVNDGYVIKNAAGADRTSNFKKVVKVDGTLTVNPKAVTVTTGSGSKAYDGEALTNNQASIDGLIEGETAKVSATGSQLEVGSAANTYSIEWDSAKASNYSVTENLGTLTVTENNSAVILTAASASKTYDGTALTDATVTASGLPKDFTVSATATGSQTDAGSSLNKVSDKYVIRNASGADRTASFTNVTKADGTLTVNKAALTIATGSGTKKYDGAALKSEEATVTGLVEGETAEVTATGTQTEVGSSDNTYSIEWGSAKAANYSISENLGTLTVIENDAEVTLTAASDSKKYDGTELTAAKVTASGLPSGFTVDATADGTITDAGTVDNNVADGYVIKNSAGEDRTASFTNVKRVSGTLTVEPKEVSITTGSAEKAYDGAALTNAEAVIEGLISGETVKIKATGAQTEVGSSPNSYGITWESAKAQNYKVSEKIGTLTVTENSEEVTLTAPSDSKVYDGTALTADGSGALKVEAGGLPEGFTVSATAKGFRKHAGTSANVVEDGYVIKNAAGEDKTACFTNVKRVDGSLTIMPKALTVKTGSDSKAYDGTALTNNNATIEGLVEGETVGIKTTGTITEVGSTENTYSMTWAGEGSKYTAYKIDYAVTDNLGTLTVTDNNVDVVLTAASDSKTYDGTALTAPEVSATGLPEGFTVEATASGTRTHAGSVANVVNDGYVIRNAAGVDKTANFKKVQKVDGTLTINPKKVSITTGSDSKSYDGKALTKPEVQIEGLVAGETYELKATGTITEIGSTENSYEMTWATKGNGLTAWAMDYDVAESLGTLTVNANANAIVLTAASGTKTYDGEALTADEVTATGLPAGFTVEAKTSGSQKNVGSSANTVRSGYVIKNGEGENKTSNFTNVSTEPGMLTVEPAKLTVTTGSGDKEYDGKALAVSDAEITGFVSGEGGRVTATGSQTEVGSSPNTYTIDWNLFTSTDNYSIEEKLGDLTVKANTSEITLIAASDSKKYDGKELTADSVTAEGLPEGFTVEATTSGSQKDVGTSKNTVNDGYVIKSSSGENKTDYFTNVKKADGTLKVTKREIKLTSASDEKVYDGTALINNNVTVEGDGFANGEGAVFSVTGSQTDAGDSKNTFTYTLDAGVNADNYKITTEEGSLTVSPLTDKVTVTITERSGRETYDGSAKTVSGFDVSIDNELYPKSGFTFGGSAEIRGTDAGKYPMDINAADFTNNNPNFSNVEFVIRDGTLVIDKRNVTLTSASAKAIYSGAALINHAVTVSGDGFAEGEGASFVVTGLQKIVGASENLFTYLLNERTKKENYIITPVYGILTILSLPDDAKYEAVVTAASGEFKYDGSEHSISGFDNGTESGGNIIISAGGHEYTVSGLTAEAKATNAGTYTVNIIGTPKVTDDDGKDVTNQFNVKLIPGSLKILKRSVTMTSETASKTYDGKALTGGKVTENGDGFAKGEGADYTVTGSQTLVGTSENKFTYDLKEGTDPSNYDISTAFGQLTVKSRDAKYDITLRANSLTEKYDGTDKSVSGFETLSFTVDGNTYTVSGVEASLTEKNAGTYPVNVKGTAIVSDAEGHNVSDQFAVTVVQGALTIDKRNVTMSSADDTKPYDGDPLVNDEITVSGDGFAEGEGATYDVTGSRVLVGSDKNSFTYTLNKGTLSENYDITTSFGTLTVTNRNAKYEIEVACQDAEYLYDGTDKTAEGFKTLEFSAGGHLYTVEGLTSTVTAKDAGEYETAITGTAVVRDANGNDVSDQFAVSTKTGFLKINKRSVGMTSGSATRKYNGKPLTNDKVTVSDDGFAKGEGADYTVTGRQTIVGISDNVFTYELTNGTNAANYDIQTEYGQLTVTSRDAKYGITLRPTSLTEKYDGTDKSVSGFETLSFMVDGSAYTVSGVEASRTERNAGTYIVSVKGTPIVLDSDGRDVSKQFEITSAQGTLTIEKRAVTLTSADDTKSYDGKPLVNHEVTVSGDGFADGEGAKFNVTGRRVLVGSAANSFTYTLNEGTLADNYDISTSFGTLTVTNRDAKYEIEVVGQDAEYLYDGTEKTAEGFRKLEFTVDGNSYTVEGLTSSVTAKNAGEYDTVITGTAVVKDENGSDVSDQFAVSTKSGKLRIGKRSVILTSGSETHTYTGKALTNKDVTVSGDGFAEGEGASYDVTGSRTTVGISDNTFTYTLNDGTDASNYNVRQVFGKLSVTNRDAKYVITLTPNSAEALYDGEEHSVSGFASTTAFIEKEKYEVSGLTAIATGTDTGTYAVSVTGTPVVTDAKGNDVTNQFSVVSKDASLTVTQRSVRIRSLDESREYNGKPLSGSGKVDIGGDGFVGKDGVDVTPTASRILVGVTPNSFDWVFSEGTNADNYNVDVEYGLLSIVNRDAAYEITMKANSDTVEYDGEEHSVSGFETNEFDVDDGNYKVDGVDASAIGTEAGIYETEISGIASVNDSDGNDVTEQFAVSYESGTLTINPSENIEPDGGDEGTPGNGGSTDNEGTPDNSGSTDNGGKPSNTGGQGSDGTDNGGNQNNGSNVNGNNNGTGNGSTGNGNEGSDRNGLTIETIPDSAVVTAAPAGYWAMANLIMMILTVLGGIYMLFRKSDDKDDDPDDDDNAYAAAANYRANAEDYGEDQNSGRGKRLISVITAILLAVISAVVFFITEDLSNSMGIFDKYSLLMAAFMIASIISIVTGRKRGQKSKEE